MRHRGKAVNARRLRPTADIKNMSREEKLRAMEALRQEISKEDPAPESPDWHAEVLEQTRSRVTAGLGRGKASAAKSGLMTLKILESAVEDLERGRDLYSRHGQGVGVYFLDSLFSDIDSLLLYAGIHPKSFGYHRLPRPRPATESSVYT